MKKVGILTLNGYVNYGNRLQNYALQEVIKKLGFEVETVINNTKVSSQIESRANKIKKLKERDMKDIFNIVFVKVKEKLSNNNKLNQQRIEIFKEFSFSYISETNYSISEANMQNDFLKEFDFFVTGSDQVWNPNYRKGSSVEFLTFAPKEKRIAYAPSFGVSNIPNEYIKDYQLWLSEMAHLSVREEAGADIIKDLTNRDATVVLDPTMMLTKEKWLSISKVPSNKPLKQYLLTYFLGEISKERKKILQDIAKKNDLEIINLAQIKEKKPYLSGPSEFINYVNSASVFCTDSFHGSAFSILLDTPFIVFAREGKAPSMNSRIETLLKKFKLESRSIENIKTNEQIFDIDYSHTIPILETERKKAFNYLEKALGMEK